jgi:hypothetical protein
MPVVREPAAVQDVVDPLEQALAIAEIRAADVLLFSERRRSAENGEISE